MTCIVNLERGIIRCFPVVRFATVLYFKTQHLFCFSDECNDIDLWVGAHSETPVANSVVGPLLQCILGRQFQRLKYADRYWYQNPDAGFNSGTLDILIFLYYFSTGKKLNNRWNKYHSIFSFSAFGIFQDKSIIQLSGIHFCFKEVANNSAKCHPSLLQGSFFLERWMSFRWIKFFSWRRAKAKNLKIEWYLFHWVLRLILQST